MDEVKKNLIEIINQQLNMCKENKIAPSKEVLDTINTLNIIYYSYQK